MQRTERLAGRPTSPGERASAIPTSTTPAAASAPGSGAQGALMARISASYDVLFALTAAVSRGVSEYAIRSADGEIALVARISTARRQQQGLVLHWQRSGRHRLAAANRLVERGSHRAVRRGTAPDGCFLRSNGGVVRHAKLAGQITVRRPGSAYRPNTLAVQDLRVEKATGPRWRQEGARGRPGSWVSPSSRRFLIRC